MKRRLVYILFCLFAISNIFVSCSRDKENLEVDLSQFNPDIATPNDLDKWLTDSLVNPYNIETVYRFERNFTDVNRDISPVNFAVVQPMMQSIIDVYLKPYQKIGGKTFIKTFTFKQFVLYGSPSYNTNGTITLGTADNGRRVVLYELNSMDFNNGEQIRRKMRTVHHEFTHILNQNIAIPPAFEQVSKADYTADWTGSANTAAVAKSLGFVSQYARSSFGEDFAEMVAHLLVEGQVWFDNYVATTNSTAAAALREKEKLVTAYFKDYYNIDFKALQNEVQYVLKTKYKVVDPQNVTNAFYLKLIGNKVASITYAPTASHYTTYGQSASFQNIYNNYKNTMAAKGWVVQNIQFLFQSATKVTFRVQFTNSSNAGPYYGDYDFNMTVNYNNGQTTFTKIQPEGTGTTYNNGNNIADIKNAFESIILPYLTNRIFVAADLPTTIPSTSPLYQTFGGFYVNGESTNYFYGPIVAK